MPNSGKPLTEPPTGETRLYQMDTGHIEYRLAQLEQEMLPKRMQVMELTVAQMQGEVTAIKEIARGIGVKVDSGFEKLSTDSNIRIQDLKIEQTKNFSFVKGIVWVFGSIGTLIALGPIVGDLLARVLGH